MKFCPKCGNQVNDDVTFCPACGASMTTGQPTPGAVPPVYAAPVPAVDPYDHTAEFDTKDISNNKVICMLAYLLGTMGVIIALLASHDSPYTSFHLRQALKFTVVEILTTIATAILCWTFIIPIAAGIFLTMLFVLKIICFFQICSGKAKEPWLIRSLGFLK